MAPVRYGRSGGLRHHGNTFFFTLQLMLWTKCRIRRAAVKFYCHGKIRSQLITIMSIQQSHSCHKAVVMATSHGKQRGMRELKARRSQQDCVKVHRLLPLLVTYS